MDSPQYIKGLLKPNGTKSKGRKVWSVDLETVWLPFFTATNTTGDTSVPAEALGAPLRLGLQVDGTVKFSSNGKPVIKVAKELSDGITLVRENFVAGLTAFTRSVVQSDKEGYVAQIEAGQTAGKPISERDRKALDRAIAARIAVEAAELAKVEAPEAPKAPEAPPDSKKVLVTA